MSLATNVETLATRVATECKSLRTLANGNAADLSALNTTSKTNLVAAVNELKAALDSLSGGSAGISDSTTTTTSTWSSTKINSELTSAIAALVNGAPAALDTLGELAAALGSDASFSATVATSLGYRLRFDAAQTLTSGQKTQGQANLDVYSKSDIGDPSTDFVATFVAGLT